MITNIDLLKDQLIKIENINTWLVKIPTIHPDSDKYAKLWARYTKYCIEGLWGFDNGGWRYMPGTLFFYGNFFIILDVDEVQNIRRRVKPMIRDLDWMLHYAYLEAQGFSGWSDDDEYTSDYEVLKYTKAQEVPFKKLHLVNSKGELKKFLHPRENIKKLHTVPKGVPLYANPVKNFMVFGSRGGGKSYTFAGITAHHLTFDGLKYFTEEDFMNPPTIEVCVGSGDASKSSEFCQKISDGLNEFGINNDLGVWGSVYEDDYTPNPFYRDWIGSLNPPNKKNPFRYEYEAKINDRWIDGLGTKSKLIHVNYSDKKQGGEAAAAGGRYVLCIYEEVGLQANFKDAVRSNRATVTGKAKQFGVQVAIGTSGNIELVQQSKYVFTHPNEDNFMEYDDIWENSGKIGFFLPAYLTDVTFKDENGNTDLERALEHYMKARMEASLKSDPDVLRFEKMNYPLVPSDMWSSNKGHYFPISELIEQERRLIHHGKYKTIGKPVKLTWDTNSNYGVKAEYDETAEPFYEFPWTRSMSALDGAVMIYEEPNYVNGEIPEDMYFFVLDPYVADDPEEGGSLGVLYGFLNPKYTPKGYNGSALVCSYIGKHPDGKDGFYSNIEKLIAYYGNNPRSLWYEANRGDSVRGYFVKKRKTQLLALRPNKEKGSSIYEKRVLDYGIMLTGIEQKLELISDTSDYLLQHVTHDGSTKRYYETIPDIFLIRQMISFEIKKHKNFDAVSAFILMPLVVKELEHKIIQEIEKKSKHNPMAVLSMNTNIFKTEDTHRRIEKFKQQYEQFANRID